MRKASTLVGLTVFALAATARAEEAAPAAPTAAPSDSAAPAAAPAADAPVATPAPATEGTSAVAAPAEPAAPGKRKLQVGLAFVPTGLGKFKYSQGFGKTVTSESSFMYGFGVSVGYEVLPNFVVGVAPQMLFNVKEKEPEIASEGDAGVAQIDMLARLAYEYPVVETIRVYAEALPGYSLITNEAAAKGFVLALGLGTAMDLGDRFFLNVAAGYQIGFQKWAEGDNVFDTSTRFVRVVLGGGMRL